MYLDKSPLFPLCVLQVCSPLYDLHFYSLTIQIGKEILDFSQIYQFFSIMSAFLCPSEEDSPCPSIMKVFIYMLPSKSCMILIFTFISKSTWNLFF